MREIRLKDARAALSSVVDRAMQGEPTIITRYGRPQAVVVGYQEWERLANAPSFGRLLMSAPLLREDLPARDRRPLRRVRL
jgi:prevent-host-death family protein